MMMSFQKYISEFTGLFFPDLCLACKERLPASKEDVLCVNCTYHLPKTDFHLYKENAFTERVWGRFSLETATAMFRFTKSGRVQQLIHALKYKGRKDVGLVLGESYGKTLKQATFYQNVDAIVAVPLHPKKEYQRGYNQSAMFGIGLSKSMDVPYLKIGLVRDSFTATQTKKSRMERLKNVENVFLVPEKVKEKIIGKHILLVDDVITTGATLEACALALLDAGVGKVSLGAIAFAGE